MPGFGSGPFGSSFFGEWYWAENTMYNRLPQLDRDADNSEDLDPAQPVKKLMLGVGPSLDRERRRIRDWNDLRYPYTVRSPYSEVTSHRLGKVIIPRMAADQTGVDGVINSFLEFSAPSLRVRNTHIGYLLTLSDSANPSNNREVKIASIVSLTIVRTEPLLTVDVGLLRWEIRPPAEESIDSITVEVRSGDVNTLYPNWVIRDGASDFIILSRRSFGHALFDTTNVIDRQGLDGSIDGLGRFVSPTLFITSRDIGRILVIGRTSVPENSGRFETVSRIAPSIVALTTVLTPESGPLFWALIPFPQLDLDGTALPKGLVEQDGDDGVATAPDFFSAATANFSPTEIGKVIVIRGSTLGNDGVHPIIGVPTPQQVQVSTVLVNEPGLYWELRTATTFGDTTRVEVRAPSMIQMLGYDFGLDTDIEETDFRQRTWIRRVTNWIDRKGVPDSYQMVGAITGYDISLEQLYRVSQDLAASFPSGMVYEVGESAPGRFGSTGGISLGGGGRVRFTDLAALFTPSDLGRSVRISGSPGNANDKLYQIDVYIDPQTVEFRLVDTASLPDLRVLTWRIVRLYVTAPPLLPRYDEINSDVLTLETGGAFLVDTYCWEPGFSTDVSVVVVSAVPSGYLQFTVTATGNFEVVADVGHWFIFDLPGRRFFLETVPVEGPPTVWTFEVRATVAPTAGAATLTYECPLQLSCDYCASNKILITIDEGTIVGDPAISVQKALERVYRRLNTEPKPIHVELVPIYTGTQAASFDLQAIVEV